jgi:heptosyltransferase III
MTSPSCSSTKRRLSLNRLGKALPQNRTAASAILPDLPPESRILLIRLRSIGDVVLLTPSLRLLRNWRPDLRVSVLVERRFRELIEANPCVDEVLDPGQGRGWQRWLKTRSTVRALQSRKLSLCLNLHGGARSALFTKRSGAQWKAGFAHFRRQGIYDFRIPDARIILDQPSIHTAEHQASALFWLGLPRQPIPRSELFVPESCRKEWTDRRRKLDLPEGSGYAILHPAALYRTKVWPADRFAALAHDMQTRVGLVPILSCGPGESAYLNEVERAYAAPIRRLEGASLSVFAAALESCSLFVGNDSGPAHMAAALQRPAVVIFGSSSSRIWGPWAGSESAQPGADREARLAVAQNPYECNPCRGDRCYRYERPECILSVTLGQVKSAVDSVLRG